MEIKGAVAIVTGAASGLGLATALKLAQCGARPIMIDVNEHDVKAVAKEIGGEAFGANVGDSARAQEIIQLVTDKYCAPRILINCAGVLGAMRTVSRYGAIPLEKFADVINVNLLGTFNYIRLVAQAIADEDNAYGRSDGQNVKTHERGVIINTASVACDDGLSGQAAYAASKGAISSMSLPLARELAPFGIRVMAISPGIFNTALTNDISENTQEQLIKDVVFPKRMGAPDEFADMACMIIKNAMMNGTTYRLDAGLRMSDPN